MLGVRLDPDDEARLNRFSKELRRPKSALAREWIKDRLDREDIDRKIADATALDAEEHRAIADRTVGDGSWAWLRSLDAEDGGYNWGPDGPPLVA